MPAHKKPQRLEYAPPSVGPHKRPWWDWWEWGALAALLALILWCVVSGTTW